jgi:hypothetical protein
MAGFVKPMSHVPVLIGLDACCAAAATAAATPESLGASPQQAARAVFIAMRALPQAGLQGAEHFHMSKEDQCSTADSSIPIDLSATDDSAPDDNSGSEIVEEAVDYFPDELRSPSAVELDAAGAVFREQSEAVPLAAVKLAAQIVAAEKTTVADTVESKQACKHGVPTHMKLAAEKASAGKIAREPAAEQFAVEELVCEKVAAKKRAAEKPDLKKVVDDGVDLDLLYADIVTKFGMQSLPAKNLASKIVQLRGG